jgi:VanZ family protein
MDFPLNENLWLYLPLILWICGIFYLSSNKGSVSNTSRFITPLLSFLFPTSDQEYLKTYHFIFRKLTHFLGYAVLALFATLAFYNSRVPFLAQFWYLFAFAVVLVISSSDEIKQSFYASRIGSVSDVILDCAGGITMIFLIWIYTLT